MLVNKNGQLLMNDLVDNPTSNHSWLQRISGEEGKESNFYLLPNSNRILALHEGSLSNKGEISILRKCSHKIDSEFYVSIKTINNLLTEIESNKAKNILRYFMEHMFEEYFSDKLSIEIDKIFNKDKNV